MLLVRARGYRGITLETRVPQDFTEADHLKVHVNILTSDAVIRIHRAMLFPIFVHYVAHAPTTSLFDYLDAHAGAVQSVLSLLTFALTLALVGATLYANHMTRMALEREWHPSVHVRPIEQGYAQIEVTNLSRMAIVITGLKLKFPDVPERTLSYPFSFPIAAGLRDTLVTSDKILESMQELRIPFGSYKSLPVDLSLDFNALDTPRTSRWFQFTFNIRPIDTNVRSYNLAIR